MTQFTQQPDPTLFKEAVKHTTLLHAMDEELEALEANHTWEIIDLPEGKQLVSCKWLYKTKCNQDGSIERAKDRLVVLGHRQKYGVDYL